MSSTAIVIDPAQYIAGLDEDVKESSFLTLISADGVEHVLSKDSILLSGLLTSTLYNDREITQIDLAASGINIKILAIIVKFLEHHKGVEPTEIKRPIKADSPHEIMSSWDAELVSSLPLDVLREVILAALYMDIKSLLEICCARIAIIVRKKPSH